MSYSDQKIVQTIGLYTATFAGVSVAAAQDAFSIVAPTGRRVGIRIIKIGRYTNVGDAASEIVGVQLVRGNTTPGAAGSAFTPLLLRPWFTASEATVRINDTTVASDGVEEVLDADIMNVAAGWLHRPEPDERIWLNPGERLCVRLTGPGETLTMNGTLVWEEVSA